MPPTQTSSLPISI